MLGAPPGLIGEIEVGAKGKGSYHGRCYYYETQNLCNNNAVEHSAFKHMVNDAIYGIHEPARPKTIPEHDSTHGHKHEGASEGRRGLARAGAGVGAGSLI